MTQKIQLGKVFCSVVGFMLLFSLTSCGKKHDVGEIAEEYHISSALTYQGEMELDYVEGFTVHYYDKDSALITVSDGNRFLLVPEGFDIPNDLPENIIILQKPVDNIYLVASAVMDMFVSIDALENISFSGTKEENWYIEEAKAAMRSGRIAYAGKYNMPDYEKILDKGCSLAIESNMISHSPEVKENLENFGIPVWIDYSSYEKHPLGRTEWVKVYGLLTGKEEAAEHAFEKQKEALELVMDGEKTGQTVAFFFITSNGTVNVRKSGDYVPKMIELAGGKYVFSELGDGTASSSVNMQMEEFYAQAKDADFLVYNSAIDGELHSREELLSKSPLFMDFKAFSEGNVFCTTQNLYQESMESGTFILDIYRMLAKEDEKDGTYSFLFRLE